MFKKYVLSYLLIVTSVLVTLVACGTETATIQNQPPTLSTAEQQVAEQQEQQQAPEQEPVVANTTTELPGRLLFVQQGVIWLWQGQQQKQFIGEGEAWHPTWSPDGRQIAYIERGASYSNIMLADANGQPLEQLTIYGSELPLQSLERIYDTMWALYPVWSPDGESISIASQYGPPVGSPATEYNLALYDLPLNRRSRELIYASDNAHCGRMAYAPDGTSLVYTHTSVGRDGQQLHWLDQESGTSEPLPGTPARSYDPTFSPDGDWLAFAARDGADTDIWVLATDALDGGSPVPRRLTNMGSARAPTFSPDGEMIAFLAIPESKSGFDLWVVDLDVSNNGVSQAGDPRQITQDMALDADSGLSWAQ